MRETVDLVESFDGDLIIDNGDFLDTKQDYALALYQVIRTLLNTEIGDFLPYKQFGINLSDYLGRQNTEAVANEIVTNMKHRISINTVLHLPEIDIIPFPIGKHSIGFVIQILSMTGTTNRLLIGFDSKNGMIKTLQSDPALENDKLYIDTIMEPSKLRYLNR